MSTTSNIPAPTKNASKHTYAGLFMITLATLMFEIHLTRIFSITMLYHFAFVAVSIAMFGMTVGAVLVYLLPSFFALSNTKQRLAQSALFFGGTIVLAFLAHLAIPFDPSLPASGFTSVLFTFLLD